MNLIARISMPAIGILALSACTYYQPVTDARGLNVQGDGFNQHLAREYRDLALFEADKMADWQSAVVYANKSLSAAAGEMVLPEEAVGGAWSLREADVPEFQDARSALMAALDAGGPINGRTNYPAIAATAQSKFDCWMEQTAGPEGHQADHIAACRDGFRLALEQMQPQAAQVPPPVLVFFDWDRANVQAEAQPILDRIAQALNEVPTAPIRIVGHTDTSGSAQYNMGLSMRRAESVRDALVARGIDAARIELVARGQSEPLVSTGDNVREPQNRRAQIEASEPR